MHTVLTDGHIAAVIPAEGLSPEDHSVLIGLDTMKELRSVAKRNRPADVLVHTNGKIVAESLDSRSEFSTVSGQYPRIDAMKPKFEGPATVGIDVALLMRLAQALSEDASNKKAVVSLWIKDSNSAVGVKVGSNSEAWGVIMPCRV